MSFLLICLFPVQAVQGNEDHTKDEVHGAQQDCSICHVSHGMKAAGLLKTTVSELCFECHPDRKGSSEHIVDVVPSMDVGEFPLIEGKMTCVTCHDSHKNTYENMLRVEPKYLCQGCHKY